MTTNQVKIAWASSADLEEILDLQRLCYQSEAALYNDYSIPPLRESLAELMEQLRSAIILKGMEEGRIVGSVRAEISDGTCSIGRLIVHPDDQNQGIGKRLMAAIEQAFPTARRYELFTGYRSTKNLSLYHKLGYREFRRKAVSGTLTLVCLQKTPTANNRGTDIER